MAPSRFCRWLVSDFQSIRVLRGLAVLDVQPGRPVDGLDELPPVDLPDAVHLHDPDDVDADITGRQVGRRLEVDVVLVRLRLVERSHEVVSPRLLNLDADLKSREDVIRPPLPFRP